MDIACQSLAFLFTNPYYGSLFQFYRHNVEIFQHVNLQLCHHHNYLQAVVILTVLVTAGDLSEWK